MESQLLRLVTFWTMLLVVTSVQSDDSLYIDVSGNVGVGTSSPTSKLEVQDESNAAVLVRNTSEIKTERVMFQLQNNGKTRFMIKNRDHIWTFNNIGSRFQITKFLSGPPVEFEVWDNGDGHFGGDVYANEFLLTSSRESKTDFETVNSATVLERLDQLEILSWRYKEDDAADRHIGPIAEDFQSVFNLGNGTHISAVDTSGIAFAAIKGLHDEAQQQAAKMESLQAENKQLVATNADLEKRLKNLEKLLLPGDLVSTN
jgi:hypothetical protein